jgi:glycosyltransferase involved in cell wall biosynthesis
MTSKKQQIIFIGRLIWGGGAEKVMYYLSHQLDRDVFEPHITYMIRQDDAPITFDPSIPLYCLDPSLDVPVNKKGLKIFGQDLTIRQYISKKLSVSTKNKIRSFINRKKAETFIGLNPLHSSFPEKQDVFTGLGNLSQALSIPLTYTYRFNKILSNIEDDAIIISIQEEPTVQAWLNQIYNRHSYISYLCAPESIHLPLMYPDPQRLVVERWIFSNACRAAKYITVPNLWMRDDMVREFGVPFDHVKVVSNPIDCKLILQKSESPLDLDIDLEGKTIFVQLARLDPQKNHDLTVKACEILRQKYDDFIVLLIGDGSESKRIKKMVQELRLQNHIIFLGEKANPYPYLKIARSSILTSTFEASPLALIDSLLLGAVPISVDCIAGTSDILGNGQYGLLVPPNDPALFAEAMLHMAQDEELYQNFRKLGMEHAYSFDISLFVEIWTNMLLDIRNYVKENFDK